MKKKILVIGVGSSGILTIGQMLAGLDSSWEVHSVHNPDIPILGVGEATSTNTPYQLFKGTDFVLFRDGHHLSATLKHSVKYTNWRPESFDSLIMPPGYALHFDNTKLKDFAFMRFEQNFPNRFVKLLGNVEYFKNIEGAVEVKINDAISTYDYVIDCSGFPKDFTDYEMVDLPINHALVTAIKEPGDWNYTHHWAHPNGWMFGIPLQHRQGWGYMYNDTITTLEEAKANMCDILKINPEEQEFREYKFKPYFTSNGLINGRCLKNGNQFLFFEPMEALSMEYYTTLNTRYIQWMMGKIPTDKLLDIADLDARSLVRFYRFVYHGGSNYDTPFWRMAKETSTRGLAEDKHWQGVQDFWNESRNMPHASSDITLQPFPAWVWLAFCKNLGYNYFELPTDLPPVTMDQYKPYPAHKRPGSESVLEKIVWKF
jgi:hypothetical protein